MDTAVALAHPTAAGAAPATEAAATRQDAPVPGAVVKQMRVEIRTLMGRANALLRSVDPAVDLDLDQPARAVLDYVVSHLRVSTDEVAQNLGMSDLSVGRIVYELEQLGLVSVRDARIPGCTTCPPSRSVLIPTSMGRRVHGEGAAAAADAVHARLAGWTAEEVETLTRLLAKLNQSAA